MRKIFLVMSLWLILLTNSIVWTEPQGWLDATNIPELTPSDNQAGYQFDEEIYVFKDLYP